VVDVLPDNGLDFVAAMQRIIDTAAHNGIAAGGHFSKLEHADRTIRQGGRFIPFSSDVRLIERGLPPFLSDLYAAASDAAQH
jgi:2-keto-3-deoxy-L-rhamnonate aldolase RhmA